VRSASQTTWLPGKKVHLGHAKRESTTDIMFVAEDYDHSRCFHSISFYKSMLMSSVWLISSYIEDTQGHPSSLLGDRKGHLCLSGI
jgi:hypothetical protein